MMAADELAALPDDWCVFKTDEGWGVGELSTDCYQCSGSFHRLASAPTLAEAIAAAHVEVDRLYRESLEVTADYQRRKADGQLTPMEKSAEFTTIYAERVLRRMTEDASPLVQESWVPDGS